MKENKKKRGKTMADPVADFLAREQDMFADLESPVGQQQQPVFGNAIIMSDGSFVITDEADFDGFDVANGNNGGNDVPPVDSGVDLQGLVPTNLVTPTLSLRSNASGTSLDFSTIQPVFNRFQEEPETLKKWREENEKNIVEKDKVEATKKEEWKASGKRELESWYAEREVKLEAVKKANREHEAALVKSSSSSPSDDKTPDWKKIASLCDMSYKSARDLSRMRELITSM
ncbi:Clathrin light chain [Strongyloides ratti]|uniref:Clathrin light chain n=1 Tax=Strongyloides ratti TaxID=34506 RepID=A0A090LN99_STRRB|nr:Clathrin light chain [Strongyloides ratti]CEF69649.1 Clathrin light chain [Strongyloides ratti]